MEPFTYSWLDGATKLGPTKADLSILQDNRRPSIKQPNPRIKATIAAKLAIEALNKYERSDVAALRRIFRYCGQAIPFMVFDELDAELFRGVLKGQVYMTWHRLSATVHGRTSEASRISPRVTIELNEELYCRRCPIELIMAVLIHHMAHAYFLVCCGYGSADHDPDMYDLGHGLEYSTLLCAIQQGFRPCQGRFPNLFECNRGVTRYLGNVLRPPTRIRRSLGHSTCTYMLRDLPDKQSCVEHMRSLQTLQFSPAPFKGNTQPAHPVTKTPYPIAQFVHRMNSEMTQLMPVLRTAPDALVASDYREFHFKGKAVQVPYQSISGFSSLVTKFSSGLSQYLSICSETSEETFIAFYAFLTKGCYLPVISSGQGFSMQSSGPPKILPFAGKEKTHLLEDVRVYHLALTMGFDELRKHALRRLWSYAVTESNPMKSLEEIYKGIKKEDDSPTNDDRSSEKKSANPDKDLRDWVRNFLRVVSSSGHSRSNLDILRKDPPYKFQFDSLRNKGGAFLEDCDAAADCLARQKTEALAHANVPSNQYLGPDLGHSYNSGRQSPVFVAPLRDLSPLTRPQGPTGVYIFGDEREVDRPSIASRTPLAQDRDGSDGYGIRDGHNRHRGNSHDRGRRQPRYACCFEP